MLPKGVSRWRLKDVRKGNRERRENTRKLAMGPLCGQLALAVGNVPALRVHFSLLIANWQHSGPIANCNLLFFRVIRVIRGPFSSFSRFSVLFAVK
jgi:hypothetical protein